MVEEPMELSDRHPGSPIVVAGSVRGTGHDEEGASCEDAFAFESFETPQHAGVAFAVADGAGSASHAAIGAEVSTRKVVEGIVKGATRQQGQTENGTWEQILEWSFFRARVSLDLLSRTSGIDRSAFAATMLAGAFLEDGRLAYAQVGDGAIVARRAEPARPEDLGEQPLEEQSNEAAAAEGTPAEETLAEETDAPGRENGSLALVTKPQGKYANEMIPLSSSESREHWQIGVSEGPVEGVAAFTDGLSHMCLDLGAGAPRDSFLGELFRINARVVAEDGIAKANAGLRTYLGSGEVQSRTRDDVTLLLALRPSGMRSLESKEPEVSEPKEPEPPNSAEPDAPPEPDVGDGASPGSEAERTPSGKASSEEFSSEKSSSEKSASWTDEILPLSVERVTETVRKAFT